ncbi:hypothetical protein INR49_018763 [Caranx melampygus]|nr:hypothetical protein INR49_018763 [Caranx melampygus]
MQKQPSSKVLGRSLVTTPRSSASSLWVLKEFWLQLHETFMDTPPPPTSKVASEIRRHLRFSYLGRLRVDAPV